MPSASHAGDAFGVFYWRRLQRLILMAPSASYTDDALNVLYWRRLQCHGNAWCDQPVDLTLALTLTLTLVDAWGSGELKVSPAPSTWHFSYG